jgi:drug/metabolite transporter (DMT)-like permease
VARIGQLQVLQPLFTILIAATILGEVIDLETVLFAVAVVIIVALGRRATIREQIPTTA